MAKNRSPGKIAPGDETSNGPPKLLLKDRDVAELLAMSRRTVWRKTSQQVLPQPIQIAGGTRWRYDDIKAFVDAARKN